MIGRRIAGGDTTCVHRQRRARSPASLGKLAQSQSVTTSKELRTKTSSALHEGLGGETN